MGHHSSDSGNEKVSRRNRSRSLSSSSNYSSSRRRHKKSSRHKHRSSSRSRSRSRSRSYSKHHRRHHKRSRSRSRDRSRRKHGKQKHKRKRRSSSADSSRSDKRYSKSRSNRSSPDQDRSRRSSSRDKNRSKDKDYKGLSTIQERSHEIVHGTLIDLTETEKLSRNKAIAAMGGDTFIQQSFISSRSLKAQISTTETKEAVFDFGTQAELNVKKVNMMDLKENSLFSPYLFGDPEEREEKYLKKIFSLRQKIILEKM